MSTAYLNKQKTGGYGGCLVSGAKLAIMGIVIVSICIVLFSCATAGKGGCPNPYKWEAKNKFNK